MKENTVMDDDLAYLLKGKSAEKVSKEVALDDFKRFLTDHKLLDSLDAKISAPRGISDDDDDANDYITAKNMVIKCIMNGTFTVTSDSPCKIIHKLIYPLKNHRDEILHDEIEYSFVPELIDLKKTEGSKRNQNITKTQQLLAVMTKKTPQEFARVASVDIAAFSAISFFLIG